MSTRKEEILEAAAELLQTRAYSAFSYQDISNRLGITKASIHGHYRTKEILGNQILEKFYSEYEQKLKDIDASSPDAVERFNIFIDNITIKASGDSKICPVCVLQTEYNIIPETMQKGVSKIHNLRIDWFTELLRSGRDKGSFVFPGRPEDQAALIVATIQGALMNARAEDAGIFDIIITQLKRTMAPVG